MTCFYCDKRHHQFTQDGIRWMLSDGKICQPCRTLLESILEPDPEPKKTVVLEREKVYQKPIREPGEDG